VANLTAQMTLDLSAVQAQFQSIKTLAAQLPAKIQAVQGTVTGITVTGAPGAPGTMTFTVDNSNTDATVADLLTAVTALRDAVIVLQNDLDAMVPTVTSVS